MGRIESVDVFRLFALTAVIAIHTQPFSGNSSIDAHVSKYLSVLIDQIARFAVPFFFVISGYFWGIKIKKSASVASASLPMAKKILIILVVWSIVYALPYNLSTMVEYGLLGPIKVAYWNLIYLAKNPVTLVTQGTKVHLWFLIALLCSLGISSIFVDNKHYKTLITLSVALYLIGLIAKAYSNTPFGIHTNFNTRNGPFFGTIFFVSGYFLSNLTPNPGWFSKGLVILGVGWFIHFLELYLLWRLYHVWPHQDYVLGTYFMGLGAAVASLSNNAFFQNIALNDVGKFSLGIYAIHFVFVDLLRPIGKLTSSPLWEIGYIMLVLFFSIASVMVLSRSNITRRFIV